MRRTIRPFTPLSTLLVVGLTTPAVAPAAALYETHYVPMRDGTLLATDVYRPDDGGTYPTVLIRTPYGKGHIDDPFPDIITDTFGYTVVIQDTRGQGASEGLDQVFYTDGWGELQDGYDTVDWIVQQPWSNANVGEMGVSAMGIAAELNAGAGHPALKTIHVGIAPTDFYEQVSYQGGSFREALVFDWVNGQGAGYMIDTYQAHPYDDAFWQAFDIRDRMTETVRIPAFFYGGFHDCFAEGTVSAWQTMAALGAEAGVQRLVMGPWTHIDAGGFDTRQGELEYPQESIIPLGDVNPFAWFDQWLKGEHRPAHDLDHYPVRFWVMGDPEIDNSAGQYWAWSKSWPVDTTTTRLYLRPDGTLADRASSGFPEPLAYVHDPRDPSPTIGGRELTLPAGPRDQRPLMGRDDVLVFETEPLTEAFTVAGTVKAALYVTTDAPDTDFTVRLADGYPDGRSMLVVDGILRTRARYGSTPEDEAFMTPGVITRIDVELGTTAQVFDKGHRIQVIVSSSNHRRFKVASNTDDAFWADTPGVPALNEVYVDEAFPSQILLPQPRRGAWVRFPDRVQPSREAERRALAKHRAGRPLTEADEAALSQAAGRALLEMGLGAVEDTFGR